MGVGVRPNGKAMRDLRQRAGLTQEDVASQARLALRTIVRMEAGERVAIVSLRLVAELLGIEAAELMADNLVGNEPKQTDVIVTLPDDLSEEQRAKVIAALVSIVESTGQPVRIVREGQQ